VRPLIRAVMQSVVVYTGAVSTWSFVSSYYLAQRQVLSPLVVMRSGVGIVYGAGVVALLIIWQLRHHRQFLEAIQRQEQLEREILAQQRNETVAQMALGIAHDFNNTLMTVGMNIELATEVPSEMDTSISRIRTVLDHGRQLTRQLMLYANATHDRRVLDISTTIQSMADLIRSAVPRQIQVHYDLVDATPCLVDPLQITQVVMNLVINGAEALADHGSITITSFARQLDGEPLVVLQISDTGCGIPPELLHRIFDPFFTTKPNGHGVGLSSSARIIREHGGTISVTSQPNTGTTFTIVLPRVEVLQERMVNA